MLKLLHTADWHLGQRLHGQSRVWEHERFLEWLLDQLVAHQVDVLLVAGDLFDAANPPAEAQRLFFQFVTRARARLPRLQMVFLAGNHDSPARLESAAPLLELVGGHAIGAVRRQKGVLEAERQLLPLRNARGEEEVLCAAMPYLRPADLPGPFEAGGLSRAVERCYHELLSAARARQAAGQALMTTGHCYLAGGRLSELSERRIQLGNQEALPPEIFGRGVDYVALGHLHRPQAPAKHIRYSGSPLPLSLAERDYPHQVLLVTFDSGTCRHIEPLRVPRLVEILRLPQNGPRPWKEVRARLERLQLDEDLPPERHPYLELRVLLEQPRPGLWEEALDLLKGRPVRLLRLSVTRAGHDGALADAAPRGESLDRLDPDEVFRRCYGERHDGPVPEALMAAFRTLRQQVEEGEA